MSFGKRQSGLPQSYRNTGTAPAAPSYTGYAPQQIPSGTGSDGGDITINVGRVRPAVWMRYVSTIIDFVILFVLTMLVMFGFDMMDGGLSGGVNPKVQQGGLLTLALIVLWVGYGIVLESSSWQGTVGKKLTGLIVTDNDGEPLGFGRAVLRALGKVVSACTPFYLSYIMAHHTKHKQALHDLIGGSRVYRRADAGPGSSSYFD